METTIIQRAKTLSELKASGWRSKSVKQELHDNLLGMLANKDELFPGIVGYDNTVIPASLITVPSVSIVSSRVGKVCPPPEASTLIVATTPTTESLWSEKSLRATSLTEASAARQKLVAIKRLNKVRGKIFIVVIRLRKHARAPQA